MDAVTTVLLAALRVVNSELSGERQQTRGPTRLQLPALPAEAWYTILGMLLSHQLGQRPQPLTIGGVGCGTIYPQAPRRGELTNDTRPTEGADMLINAPPWGLS